MEMWNGTEERWDFQQLCEEVATRFAGFDPDGSEMFVGSLLIPLIGILKELAAESGRRVEDLPQAEILDTWVMMCRQNPGRSHAPPPLWSAPVACPTCSAPIGMSCTTVTGHSYRHMHKPRRLLADAL